MAQDKDKSNVIQDVLQNGQLAWRLYTDSRVSTALKVLLPVAAFAYFLLPLDFLPDFIPVIGQLDEVAIVLLLMQLFISMAPQEVVAEHRGETASTAAGAQSTTSSSKARSKNTARNGREDVIDADFRVVNDD
ncbi:MAG: YkvA family protein [Anaerolineae bacterium]